MENHHFQWGNSLFLWPFSIANCEITGGSPRALHGRTSSENRWIREDVGPEREAHELVTSLVGG